jgi:hypothetical protein
MAAVLAPQQQASGPSSGRDADKAEADRLLTEGKKVYLDDPDCAVEQLQAAMKIYDTLGLANDPCAAPLFLAYGLALVETARASSDVFGQKVDSMGAKEKLMGPGGGGQENRDPKGACGLL